MTRFYKETEGNLDLLTHTLLLVLCSSKPTVTPVYARVEQRIERIQRREILLQ